MLKIIQFTRVNPLSRGALKMFHAKPECENWFCLLKVLLYWRLLENRINCSLAAITNFIVVRIVNYGRTFASIQEMKFPTLRLGERLTLMDGMV